MTFFYHFSQNNTGGSFDVIDKSGITVNVVIEAESEQHANELAENIGIYFDGCDDGIDCPCCGDRWCGVSKYDKQEYPHVYGDKLGIPERGFSPRSKWAPEGVETCVHYLDGRKEWYGSDNMPRDNKEAHQ